MIDSALVLNCPSTMGAYQHRHIENILIITDFGEADFGGAQYVENESA